jgi:hypothetical protein
MGEAQPRYFHSFAGAPQARVVSCKKGHGYVPVINNKLRTAPLYFDNRIILPERKKVTQ